MPEKKQPVPTIVDIARLAATNRTSVSVVLNGGKSNSGVSAETRERILKAAAELRYSPNPMARGLKKVRVNTIGVSCPSLDPDSIIVEPYSAGVLAGIVSAAHGASYNVTLCHKTWHDAHNSATSFLTQALDGFLVVAPVRGSDMVPSLAALRVPLVAVSSSSDQYGVPSVDVDNEAGVRQAICHLLGLGHRRIAHLMNHPDLMDAVIRRDVFLQVMAEAGCPVPAEYVRDCDEALIGSDGRPVPPTSYDRARYLLTLPERPTAVFATNDRTALSVMDAARDLGIRVPEELSVVGFDDAPLAASANPPLTTVRQPLWEMGQVAARMLIALVEGEPVPAETRLFAPELVVRASTGPP